MSSTGTISGAESMTYGQYIEVYEQSIKRIQNMLQKKSITIALAKQMRRSLEKEHLARLSKPLGGTGLDGTGDGHGGDGSGGGGLVQKQKLPWPAGPQTTTAVAYAYPTYEGGLKAVLAAFKDNSLYPGIGNHAEAAAARSKKHPGGAGEPKRGYVDWDFGNGEGCRYATLISNAMHDISMIHAIHVISLILHIACISEYLKESNAHV